MEFFKNKGYKVTFINKVLKLVNNPFLLKLGVLYWYISLMVKYWIVTSVKTDRNRYIPPNMQVSQGGKMVSKTMDVTSSVTICAIIHIV